MKIVEKDTTTQSDEAVKRKHKGNGHNQTELESSPDVDKESGVNVHLVKHMESLSVSESQCDICQEKCVTKEDLDRHMKNRHSKQWNCDQCDFQASSRSILMNHCKLTKGHQPSKQRQRQGQTGVLECYTCKSEFRNYHDLMEHRKEEHPSHKKCRYFIKGECKFSSHECWYLHEESDNYNESEHKKKDHHARNNHPSKATKKGNITPTPIVSSQPLSSVWQGDFWQPPPAAAPDQTALMFALNMLNQKLDTISSMTQRLQTLEEKMFPKLI